MRFRTKVDWWIGLAIALGLLAGPVAIFATREWAWLAMVLISDVVIALVVWPCDYTLTKDDLQIRSGIMRWRIPYQGIDRVYPTRNPISSPAWSLDRIAVCYGKKWVLVSPEAQRDFVTKLGRAAGMNQRGMELYREANKPH